MHSEAILDAAARIREQVDPTTRVDWLDLLRGNGLALWEYTYGRPDVANDLQALAALIKYVEELPESPRKSYLRDMMTVPSCRQELLSDVLWVHEACAIVQTTHRWAAAAICTSLPETLELHTPWRAWILEIPDRLLWVEDPEQHQRTWLRYALVRVMETEVGPRWSITAMADASIVQLGTRNLTQQELLKAEPSGDPGTGTALEWPIPREVDRIIACLKSLVTNLLIAMSNPEWCRPLGKHRPGWTRGPQREEGAPQHRRFMVARPTKIDVRQQVVDYCAGGRQPSTVATLVRGHWTHQPYGPRSSLRKLIWREPAWRGSLDAPIKPAIKVVDFMEPV